MILSGNSSLPYKELYKKPPQENPSPLVGEGRVRDSSPPVGEGQACPCLARATARGEGDRSEND